MLVVRRAFNFGKPGSELSTIIAGCSPIVSPFKDEGADQGAVSLGVLQRALRHDVRLCRAKKTKG